MSCGIYKWTSPSGKSYIGQSVNLEKRYYEFLYSKHYSTSNDYKKLTKIDRARKKYPDFEQWTYEILEYCEPNELNDGEQYYINLYNTFKNGYNETSGGNGISGYKHKDETKVKIRNSLIGKGHTEERRRNESESHKGKHRSDEVKEKIRQAHLGKTQSDETKDKIGKANAKQVDQYSLDGTYIQSFPSTMEIERQLGFAHPNIANCCKGKLKSASGFIWRYHN